MGDVINLLDRRLYTFAQVDDLLSLSPSTAQRWIDGYSRQGKDYRPVVRRNSTGIAVATWGEFVECRFLAEFRHAGVPMLHMRPVFERLRDELEAPYPFASPRLWLEPQGREIVARVQDELGEELEESLFVVRTNDRLLPIDWSPPSIRFRDAVEWSAEPEHEKVIILVWADGTDHKIEINPRRSFGEPVVRGIKTSALADAWRASLAVLPSPQFDKNTAYIPVGDSTKR